MFLRINIPDDRIRPAPLEAKSCFCGIGVPCLCCFAVALALVGCGADKNTTAENLSATAVKASALPPQIPDGPGHPASNDNPPAGTDTSLTTEQYMALGMPNPDHTWTVSDMEVASKLITEFSKSDPSKLPRYQSTKSGEVFQRVFSNQNLEPLRSPSIPVEFRFAEALRFLQAVHGVSAAYIPGVLTRTTSDDELTDITGQGLRSFVVLTEIVNQFLPTLDPQSPTYPTRMEGLKQVKSATANAMRGAMKQISLPGTWKAEPLRRFIRNMDETFPVIITFVTPTVKTEILTKLEQLSANPGLNANKQVFVEMVSKVSVAANESLSREQD